MYMRHTFLHSLLVYLSPFHFYMELNFINISSYSCLNFCFRFIEKNNFLLIYFLLIALISEVNYLKVIYLVLGNVKFSKTNCIQKSFFHNHFFLNNCFFIMLLLLSKSKVSPDRIVRAVFCLTIITKGHPFNIPHKVLVGDGIHNLFD